MKDYSELSRMVETGKVKGVKKLTQQAIAEGDSPYEILDDGLLAGMNTIAEKFRTNEVYVPEVLMAVRALNAGIKLLRPLMTEDVIGQAGTAVVGTVSGDLHDVGKNLVKLMMETKGIRVIDLGVDVPAERFIEAAVEHHAGVICCSALLTTTMHEMENVVSEAVAAGIRDQVRIVIGGAPVTQEFCDRIGADAYTADAVSAAETVYQYLTGSPQF